MATRNGKVANLPNDIREQLNLRLLEGESGRELAAWLNALPNVQSILGLQFNGSPISEVNLTHWRQGGYLQWFTERDCFDSARALADGDCNLAETGLSAERLLNILTLRIGQLLMRWDFSLDEGVSKTDAFSEVARKARILQGISRFVLAIHRIQSQQAREKPETARPATNSPAMSEEGASPRRDAEPIGGGAGGPANAGKGASCSFGGTERGVTSGRAAGASGAGQSAEPLRRGAGGGKERGEPPRGGAGGGMETAEPLHKFLAGAIDPSSASSNLSHTPFKPDPDLAEILDAV